MAGRSSMLPVPRLTGGNAAVQLKGNHLKTCYLTTAHTNHTYVDQPEGLTTPRGQSECALRFFLSIPFYGHFNL